GGGSDDRSPRRHHRTVSALQAPPVRLPIFQHRTVCHRTPPSLSRSPIVQAGAGGYVPHGLETEGFGMTVRKTPKKLPGWSCVLLGCLVGQAIVGVVAIGQINNDPAWFVAIGAAIQIGSGLL